MTSGSSNGICSSVMSLSTRRRRVSPLKSAMATELSKTSNPSEAMGLGFNFEPGLEKPLILAAARAQHHPVLSQPDGRGIGVGRHMIDRQYRHSLSMRFPPAARAVCERVIARATGGVSTLVETRRIFARPVAADKGTVSV